MGTSKRSKKVAEERSVSTSGGIPAPWSEFLGIALLAVGGLLGGGLVSYQTGDGTLMGPVGLMLAASAYAGLGMASYLLVVGVVAMGLKALTRRGMELSLAEGIGFSLATIAGCVLLHVMFPAYRVHGYTAGGLLGELLGEVSLGLFHHAGTYLVALTVMCVGLLASTPLTVEHLTTVGRVAGQGVYRGGVYVWTSVVELLRSHREPDPMDEDEDGAAFEEDHLDDDAWAVEDDEGWVEDDEVIEDEDEDEELALDADETDVEPSSRPKRNRRTDKKRGVSTQDRGEGIDPDEPPEIIVHSEEGGAVPDAKVPEGMTVGAEATKEPEPGTEPKPSKPMKSLADAKALHNKSDGPAKAREGIPGVIQLTSEPYELPPLDLFASAKEQHAEIDRDFVLDQAQRLVTALSEFRIRGKVTKIHPGPVITRYEFKPEAGVKLSRIESLENDLAMALEAIRIRILAPIPGKATVGFEVPNKRRETVYIKEILSEEGFGKGKKLPLALGKDITGSIVYTDLAKAPHLLVAGATGSGKSVGVNSMICSLLYTCSPDEVRMIMIDPKMLELSIYEGIPHLLLPVVTDSEKAALALRWAVQEMERRYKQLSEAQVRDIAGYNRKLPELVSEWEEERRAAELVAGLAEADAKELGEDGVAGSELSGTMVDAQGNLTSVVAGKEQPDKPTKMPYVVVVIDEFADLMMVASKEVEQAVARIAAKARAAGIHLILATQRPSVDVITGTIKNNFPSRIAFQVTSEADSRTILDGKGAKQLLGMGDMLHMDRGMQSRRVHGCFVSEDEILEVVEFIKKQAKPVYNMDIIRKDDDELDSASDENLDSLYDRAVEIVAEAQKVSTSMLQRRLGVGYNRAAKIVESMEERGVIGPARGTTPREVYVTAM